MKNKVLLFFIGVILCSMDLFAQERKISGIVKGENDQELMSSLKGRDGEQ